MSEHEQHRAEVERELALRAHDRNSELTVEYQRAAIASANATIRSLILVNGGAVIALLAFVGALESGDGASSVSVETLVAPIRWFAVGVGLATLTAALAYLVNLLDSDISSSYRCVWKHPYLEELDQVTKLRPWRMRLHYLAIVVAFCSLISFGLGVWTVTRAVGQLGI